MMKIPKLIVIAGETASGKSALALNIAMHCDGEIICADSWTVRREVSIGTAKPSQEEQAVIPHHLLDVVEPDEVFTAAAFKELTNQAIADISARGKLPIMVGGTGLYIDAVLYDYGFRDTGDLARREAYNAMTNDQLIDLIKQNSIKIGAVDIQNKRRLIRLLETNGAEPTKQALRENTFILGLKTDREVLRGRVEKRTQAMIDVGLEQEVAQLVKRYGWDCEALKGIGYAQWKDYFEGTETLQDVTRKINKATMDLAKRQRTWFKRNNSIHWLSTPVNEAAYVDTVTTFLKTK